MATALETNSLEAQPREAGTKNDARRVRQGGKIPAVVYGAGKDSVSVSVDPRVVSRGETVPLAHPKYGTVEDVYGMGMPIKFSKAQAGFDQPPPDLGEHNHSVYCDLLGYSEERFQELKTQRVI